MNKYPDWTDGTPRTDAGATVKVVRPVASVRAIKVENAQYRAATLSGMFELEVQNRGVSPIRIRDGKQTVTIVCAWHGVTPETTYPHLIISGSKYTIIDHYTGDVADNIA